MNKASFANSGIKKERLKLLYSAIISSQVGLFFAAIVLTMLLKDDIEKPVITMWLLAIFITIIYRVLLYFAFKKAINDNLNNIKLWENRFLFSVFLSALAWGSAGIVLYSQNNVIHQGFLEITLAGIVAVSIGTLAPSIKVISIFMPIIFFPIAINSLLSGSLTGLHLTGMITIYIAISLISARRFNRSLIENLQLRYDSKDRTKALKNSEEKYRVLYELSEDPMLIMYKNQFIMGNHAAVELFGYESETHLLSVDILALSPEFQEDGKTSQDKSAEIIKKVFTSGHYNLEWSIKKLNGEIHPVNATLTLIPYENSKGVFYILRDVTENKKIEQELIKAYELAQAANHAKSNFLANMSHEIRTPMNGVVGNTELLLLSSLTEPQRNHALAIQESSKDMLVIMNDILDYSKVEAGKLELQPHKFSLARLIQNLNSQIENQIANKNLKFICFLKPELHKWYVGDSGRIQQILLNLTDNAIKFTNRGKITVSCDEISSNGKSCLLKFTVKDTGIGIDKKQHQSLFQRFSQGDSSTTREYGGTGLGLSICKQLTELMEGKIGFESTLGKGSLFWFSIKLQKAQTQQIPEYIDYNYNTHFNHAKILVVEDNKTNQMVAKHMLETFEINVDVVDNGKNAVDILSRKPFDLIFMDCQMPIMDGYEATRQIRNVNSLVLNHSIPIIAMTAHTLKGDREKCLNSGMDGFMSKPISIDSLHNILYKWLQPPQHNLSKQQNYINLNTTENKTAQEIIFDYDGFSHRLSGNTNLIQKTVFNFLGSMKSHLKDVENAIKNGDFKLTQETAHKLKGSAITIGCLKMARLASEIENQSHTEDKKIINDLFVELNPCYLQTKLAVKHKIPSINLT